ncbi:hypothetical protein DZG01_26980 [Pseudomonas fluorescens]|nr:hypothetical protein DZG01_26980 [Pseudomonas fluorescens]
MVIHALWRGDLSPLGCAADPKRFIQFPWFNEVSGFGTAAQSSGSKLPRHRFCDRRSSRRAYSTNVNSPSQYTTSRPNQATST